MKQLGILLFGLGVMAFSCDVAASSAIVTNGNDSGAGSLRAALASGSQTVHISSKVQLIKLEKTLTYNNPHKLHIFGAGQTIDATAIDPNTDILSISGAGDLLVTDLNLIGSFDGVNDDPTNPMGGKGIEVNISPAATDMVTAEFRNVFLTGVGHHGIHISDCSFGDDCGSGSGGAGDGSAASVAVKLTNVHVDKVGFGRADADGVRVDERGEGSIYFTAKDSIFTNVGADGVELDEGNNGDVISHVSGSQFNRNGEYCNLVTVFEGTPCDDDGDRDVDDGFDIDEAGEGDLISRVTNSQVMYNFDEGLDFDEEDGGNIDSTVIDTQAIGNQDEAFKMSEEGAGDLIAVLRNIFTFDNNGSKEGIELEEADNGNVDVKVVKSLMIGGDDELLKIEQEDAGKGKVKVRKSTIGGLDLENVEQI
ncbi:MAG: hypothetical protein HWE16_10820 [Gammaproteobacteria bacterium]|nr:hypothetical protein [Gammaproteobacteria bacterium]